MIYAGVDKVRLTSRDYTIPKVSSLSGWSEKAGRKVNEPAPEWLRDQQGEVLPVVGLFMQTDMVTLDIGSYGLKAEFNPSIVRHPYHLMTDPAEVGRIGDHIERQLKDAGVLVNINAMTLSRLDTAKNAQHRHHLSAYPPAIAAVCRGGKRMKGREYPDGYANGNKQQQSMFYNKGRQLLEVKDLRISENNLGRMEYRNLMTASVQRHTGLASFDDLRKADPEQVTAIYRDGLNRTIFHQQPQAVQLILPLDTEAERLAMYIQENFRGGFEKWYADLMTMGTVANAFGGWEGLEQLVYDAHRIAGKSKDPDRTARKVLERAKQQQQRAAMVNKQRNSTAVQVTDLVNELQHAYAA